MTSAPDEREPLKSLPEPNPTAQRPGLNKQQRPAMVYVCSWSMRIAILPLGRVEEHDSSDSCGEKIGGAHAVCCRFARSMMVSSCCRAVVLVIARLLTMAKQLVIEDADFSPCHLEGHFRQFALGDLSVTDLTKQARRRGASVYLIERKQHDDKLRASCGTLSGLMPLRVNWQVPPPN